jgi:FAD/FMN-containing dehydrogenase
MTAAPAIRGEYRTDQQARALYSEGAGIYRIVPEAVALPIDEEDLETLIRWAVENRVGLIPRGAGSSVTGSNVGSGIVVDLTRLQPKVLEVHPSTGTAKTSANIRWGELNSEAAKHGLRLPPDPSSGPFATLGGMVSTNASGAHSVKYGSMRRWVVALTLITSDARRVTLRRGTSSSLRIPRRGLLEQEDLIRAKFPRTTKNSAGYALDAWLDSGDDLDLFIGAEGTLGIITGIEWRLAPIPSHRAGLRVLLGDLALLTQAVEAILALSPSALELLDRTFLDLVDRGGLSGPAGHLAGRPAESILLVEFEGDDEAALRGTVDDAVRALEGLATDIEVALNPEAEEKVWRLRHAASPIIADLPPGRRSLQVIEDACVPVARMGEYISSVRALAHQLQVPVVIFGHAGNGNIHVNVLPETSRDGWEEAVRLLHSEITDEVIRLGGTTSGEHGDGRIRSSLLERLYGPGIMGLFHQLKAALDPHGILNPGVKIGRTGGQADRRADDPLKDLKVGSGAAPIPDEIAEELREIERRGDYLSDRLRYPSPSLRSGSG